MYLVDAELLGDALRGAALVAGDQHPAQAHRVQAGERRLGLLARLVFEDE